MSDGSLLLDATGKLLLTSNGSAQLGLTSGGCSCCGTTYDCTCQTSTGSVSKLRSFYISLYGNIYDYYGLPASAYNYSGPLPVIEDGFQNGANSLCSSVLTIYSGVRDDGITARVQLFFRRSSDTGTSGDVTVTVSYFLNYSGGYWSNGALIGYFLVAGGIKCGSNNLGPLRNPNAAHGLGDPNYTGTVTLAT